jgi:hypothetical protein
LKYLFPQYYKKTFSNYEVIFQFIFLSHESLLPKQTLMKILIFAINYIVLSDSLHRDVFVNLNNIMTDIQKLMQGHWTSLKWVIRISGVFACTRKLSGNQALVNVIYFTHNLEICPVILQLALIIEILCQCWKFSSHFPQKKFSRR